MNEIFFIRHAETDMAGTLCGHSDPPLNAGGRGQISELLKMLVGESFDEVYSSDLLRAKETGEAIASSRGLVCHLSPALREIYFGRWEGLTWNEVECSDPTYAQRWSSEFPSLPAPDGEDFKDFEQRVLAEIAALTLQARERRLAVVTHAGVLRTILCELCGYSKEDAWEQTRSYCSVVRYKGSASPIALPAEVRV